MLAVAGPPVRVPSPLKRINSTTALGCATPPMMLNPEALNKYKLSSVDNEHAFPLSSLSACARPTIPNASIATTNFCLAILFIRCSCYTAVWELRENHGYSRQACEALVSLERDFERYIGRKQKNLPA